MLNGKELSNITSLLYKKSDISAKEVYDKLKKDLNYIGDLLSIEKELEKQRDRIKRQVRSKSA